MAAVATRVSAEEFAAMQFGEGRAELVRGEVELMAPAGFDHGELSGEVFGVLRDHVRRLQIGRVVSAETGFRLAEDIVRAPDAAFVSNERLQEVRERTGQSRFPSFLPTAPDLAAEVVSPGDRADDINDKIADYFEFGTRLVWFFYPSKRTVHVYTSPTQVRILTECDTLDGGDVLPGFSCPVRDIFSVL
jgi:Uma2 family endonuclease